VLKNLKSYFLILFITILIWTVIDFFFGRNLLNSIKYANNHGTIHPNYHHTFLPKVNKILYWAGLEYNFCTDNHGFRNSCSAVKVREKNFDIVFIGDSVTEGVGLDYEDTIVGIINKNLKDKKIANLAASSYSTHIYNNKIKFLLENGYTFNEVFVLIDPSDIQDDTEIYKVSGNTVISKNRKISFYNFYIDKTKYLIKKTFPMTYEFLILFKKKFNFNKKNLNQIELNDKSNIKNLGNKGKNTLKIKLPKYEKEFKNIDLRRLAWTYDKNINYGEIPVKESIKMSINQMNQLYETLISKNISLSIVIYPLPPQLAFDKELSMQVKIWEKFCYLKCKQFINSFPYFFEKLNETSFLEVNNKYFIQNDVHFNKKGNQAIANLITKHFD
tara:strand:+ start:164 stop:1324 length:1161 start_codon:yes stop_codon:yes gene_type:complete